MRNDPISKNPKNTAPASAEKSIADISTWKTQLHQLLDKMRSSEPDNSIISSLRYLLCSPNWSVDEQRTLFYFLTCDECIKFAHYITLQWANIQSLSPPVSNAVMLRMIEANPLLAAWAPAENLIVKKINAYLKILSELIPTLPKEMLQLISEYTAHEIPMQQYNAPRNIQPKKQFSYLWSFANDQISALKHQLIAVLDEKRSEEKSLFRSVSFRPSGYKYSSRYLCTVDESINFPWVLQYYKKYNDTNFRQFLQGMEKTQEKGKINFKNGTLYAHNCGYANRYLCASTMLYDAEEKVDVATFTGDQGNGTSVVIYTPKGLQLAMNLVINLGLISDAAEPYLCPIVGSISTNYHECELTKDAKTVTTYTSHEFMQAALIIAFYRANLNSTLKNSIVALLPMICNFAGGTEKDALNVNEFQQSNHFKILAYDQIATDDEYKSKSQPLRNYTTSWTTVFKHHVTLAKNILKSTDALTLKSKKLIDYQISSQIETAKAQGEKFDPNGGFTQAIQTFRS